MKMIFIFPALLLIACGKPDARTKIALSRMEALETERYVQQRSRELEMALNWDTVGVSNAGLVITGAKFVREDYANYKSVQLSFRNVSGKTIKAVKFHWYAVTAFDEPAQCGVYSDPGFGGGLTDDRLRPGGSTSARWDVMSGNGDRIIHAWPSEIVYTDGTKWKSDFVNLPL